jgi:site-specific DNA-adenine methylase
MQLSLFNNTICRPAVLNRYGIPYMGSKQKIADQILDKILEVKPKAKYFYDLFGGGAAVSFMAQEYGFEVRYNEKNEGICNLLNFIQHRVKNGFRGRFGLFPDEWYEFVNREKFMSCKPLYDPYSMFVKICYSFGNNGKDYFAISDKEKLKHLAHNIIIFQCQASLKELNNLLNTNITISDKPNYNDRRLDCHQFFRQNKGRDNQQMERMQRMEQMEQMEQTEQITITNLDYRDVIIDTPPEETVIYLDPPYRGTGKYTKSAKQLADTTGVLLLTVDDIALLDDLLKSSK